MSELGGFVGNDSISSTTVSSGVNGLVPLQIPVDIKEESISENITSIISTTTTPVANISILPSLRGTFSVENGLVICRGVWATTDEFHGQIGQTSEFEFKLVQRKGEDAHMFSGTYQGWFNLKQGSKNAKIEDREMTLTFTRNEDQNTYTIVGDGKNKFGTYTLNGYMNADSTVQMYREYALLPVNAVTGSNKRKSDGTIVKVETPVSAGVTPREASSRVRKQSHHMRDYEESVTTASAVSPRGTSRPTAMKSKDGTALTGNTLGGNTPNASHGNISNSGSSISSNNNINTSGNSGIIGTSSGSSSRPPRPSHYIVKCSELLKELIKLPSSMYFLEPVDPVALGIPDYFTIITNPMDFRTIRENLDAGKYESPEAFADHMRLVFRNALTYNQFRDNPVNMAARDVSSRFEERYRPLLAQYMNDSKVKGAKSPRAATGGGSSSTNKPTTTTSTSSSIGSNSGSISKSGPRVGHGVDSGHAQVADLQRKIAQMEKEVTQLRSRLGQSAVVSQHQQQESKVPLTIDEKKALVDQIHSLPLEKLEHVVEIVQAAWMPHAASGKGVSSDSVNNNINSSNNNDSNNSNSNSNSNDDVIEIPLEDLDVATLRRLKRYVEVCLETPKSLTKALSNANIKPVNPVSVKKQKTLSSSASSSSLLAKSPRTMSKSDEVIIRDDEMCLGLDVDEAPPTSL